jgi:hypothetical protein
MINPYTLINEGDGPAFATSDNKVIKFFENDQSSATPLVENVLIFDGTGSTLSALAVAEVNKDLLGSPGGRSVFMNNTVEHESTVQLTDTRYARVHGVNGPGSPSASLSTPRLKQIQIVEFNFTLNTATVVATYDLSQHIDPDGTGDTIEDIVLFKISDTRFGCVFKDKGVANPVSGSSSMLKIILLNDAGASITQQMAPVTMIDVGDPAINRGDTTAIINGWDACYLSTNRIVSALVEARRNSEDSNLVVSTKLNATFTGVETQGPVEQFSTTDLGRANEPRWRAVGDRFTFFIDEWANEPSYGDFPHIMRLTEINATTLVHTFGDFVPPYPIGAQPFIFGSPLTPLRGPGSPFTPGVRVGSPNEGVGSPEPYLDWEFDFDYNLVVDGTTLYLCTPIDDNIRDNAVGDRAINTSPFEGTYNLGTNGDRFVSTARDLSGTAFPDRITDPTNGLFPNSSHKVVALDTGLLWQLYSTPPTIGSPGLLGSPSVVPSSSGTESWHLITTNTSIQRGEGTVVLTINLDTGTLTPQTTAVDVLSYAGWPRWESDGAGGTRPTYKHCANGADAVNMCKLPNGKIGIFLGEVHYRIDPAAPFFTEAAWDARETTFANEGPTTIYRGADHVGILWDPTLITGSPFVYPG